MDQQSTSTEDNTMPRFFNLEMLMFTLVVLSGMVLVWTLAAPQQYNIAVIVIAGLVFTSSLMMVIRLVMDPDSVRARQSDAVLRLASQMLDCMKNGMTSEAAQTICALLLPSTAGIAVSITDRESILGYAGFLEAENPSGSVIRTHATHASIADGKMRILFTPEDIGFQAGSTIQGAIIVPLVVGGSIEGTLKFYYRNARDISETQKSIAEGFGRLISTQMAAVALEEQKKLAASMELKALQSQINPHFLFNTINTIASLVRTDPARARVLLREFATFYRRTLEDSADLIFFEREMEQTRRYFTFEMARFGSDRVELHEMIDKRVAQMLVPPFLIQPLVENAVRHAMPAEGKLLITVSSRVEGNDIVLCVEDNGVGMTEEARQNILNPAPSRGLGIAVKNVHDRICGYFDQGSGMEVESELGKGTCITLLLKGGCSRQEDMKKGLAQQQR